MPFELTKADQNALSNVEIIVDGDNGGPGITLDSNNLMFPPVVTKDSKTARWADVPDSGGFEPFKFYKNANSRQLGISFQWVTGGFNGGTFNPENLHNILSQIRAYFYGAYFGGDSDRYPIVQVVKLYNIVRTASQAGVDKSSTWRMMGFNIKRSKEMTKVGSDWYPLHIEAEMDLEAASQIAGKKKGEGGDEEVNIPFGGYKNLIKRPPVEWY